MGGRATVLGVTARGASRIVGKGAPPSVGSRARRPFNGRAVLLATTCSRLDAAGRRTRPLPEPAASDARLSPPQAGRAALPDGAVELLRKMVERDARDLGHAGIEPRFEKWTRLQRQRLGALRDSSRRPQPARW